MQSLPYRPLPKITAPIKATSNIPSPLRVGDRVKIFHGARPNGFWREYEITIIDGDKCRLVTLNKKFHLTLNTKAVEHLLNLQRASGLSQEQPSQSALRIRLRQQEQQNQQ